LQFKIIEHNTQTNVCVGTYMSVVQGWKVVATLNP
jgi:hypothetical protein